MPYFPLDDHQSIELIRAERIVRIGFDGDGARYLIPLGYIWFDEMLCGMTDEGRKTEMAAANPQVSFQLDNSATVGIFGWHSVTGEGEFELIDDTETIERLSPALFERFSDGPQWALAELGAKFEAGKTVFYRLKPRSFTGRAFTENPPE
jgi:nitroimidazol reductase NimA-like FMN-containing flavoprotein (pyridoxamine 5'-phosphate oxidase superfamily)